MQPVEKTFRHRIKQLREANGLSQDDLAKALTAQGFPMHQTTLAKIERTDRKIGIDEAAAFARYFRLPLADLLSEPEVTERERALREEYMQAVVEEQRWRAAQDEALDQRAIAYDRALSAAERVAEAETRVATLRKQLDALPKGS